MHFENDTEDAFAFIYNIEPSKEKSAFEPILLKDAIAFNECIIAPADSLVNPFLQLFQKNLQIFAESSLFSLDKPI